MRWLPLVLCILAHLQSAEGIDRSKREEALHPIRRQRHHGGRLRVEVDAFGEERLRPSFMDDEAEGEEVSVDSAAPREGIGEEGMDVGPLDESKPVTCKKEETEEGGELKTVCTQGGEVVKPWKCEEGQSICCNPRMKESYYLRCVARECWKVKSDTWWRYSYGSELGLGHNCNLRMYLTNCQTQRPGNSQGFVAGTSWTVRTLYRNVEQKALVIMMALLGTLNLEGDQNLTDNSTAREEPGAQEKWMKATCTEAVYLVLIMPFAGLSLALIYEQMKKASQSLFGKKDVRTDEMSKEMREEWMQDAQNQQKMKLNEYLTDKEQDGLGGILQMVVTEVAGMSSAKWVTTQCMSLSLYHFIVTEPVESNVCVLGKTGRLMYLMRKPLNPSSESARLLSSAGMMIILLTAVALVYFRSIERMLYLAMNFPSPGVEARLMLVKPKLGQNLVLRIAVLIDGKVHLYTFLVAAVLWLFNLVFFKATIKSWGHSDAKNYYESDNACCAQYFRSGTKSSPFAKPRRVGGMRIFFGPYPMSNLFWELGANWNFLRCLEPLARLPLEYDNGGYPSGGGSPSGPDDTAGFLQLVLGLMNSFLGTLGLFFFGVNIYNLLINIQNCPTSTALAPCIVQGTCAHVARAPWFAHYIVSNKLMLAEDLAKEAIKADIPIKEIAKWLGVETVGAAKQIIMEVAETSCNDMYAELITGPNDTVHGMASDWLGKRHAEYYLEQVENRNLNITWQAKMYSCHGCVRCMTLHYFTDIQNVVELIEIFLLIIASYMSALLAQMMGNQLENCPMIDVTFEADPTQKQTVDLHETEKSCLGMIARTFFFRYHYYGVPKHMEYLEEGLRKEEKKGNRDTKKLSDPFQIVENAKTWDDYNLFDATAVRRFNVHRELLGLLEGEEVLSAWTVPPRLTRRQKLAIAFGVLFFIVGPIITALRKRKASCGAEALLGMVLCWKYVDFFVLKRRPQAGLVLSTRRVFQVTKTPRYLGLMGYSEPLIKMDVLVHNCSIFYAQLQMETAVLAKVFGLPLSRCGQVIAQSPTGIFKMWRELGDTYNLLNYVSQAIRWGVNETGLLPDPVGIVESEEAWFILVWSATPSANFQDFDDHILGFLNKMGKVLMYNEKVAGEQDIPRWGRGMSEQ
ncbi:unnamed protein product [Cladocopium goreaui]|uniref:Uncharacterized protein n=1 Tax=Cladocopium goreaui TaxID=2562237 RepID=A0A9P1D389_9DINO|nr:unnamed protein product [Cladocopium goreaui]